MLQKLRDQIQIGLTRISESRESQFAILGEDLSTTKNAGEWKTTFSGDLDDIKTRRDTLKEKSRIVEQWKNAENRRVVVQAEIQDLEAAYANARNELEIHFEDIGAAAFDLYQQTPSSFDETADLLNDMQDLESVIREKEQELQRLETEAKPSSFLSRTLNRGRGMVIRGSLKTREIQRGRRLKLVGEHICESIGLPDLPEGSSLAKQLAPLQGATERLRDVRQRLADAKEEAESIDNERIAIERGERMRNPVKNLEHDIHRIRAELSEIYTNLGHRYYESTAREERVSERISRTVVAIARFDAETDRYEKLLVRVDAGLAMVELEKKKQKLDTERLSLSEKIEALELAQADIQVQIDAKARVRGNQGTLKLPKGRQPTKKNDGSEAAGDSGSS